MDIEIPMSIVTLSQRLIEDPLSSKEPLTSNLWVDEIKEYLRSMKGQLDSIDILDEDMSLFLGITNSPIVPFYSRYKDRDGLVAIIRNVMGVILLSRFNYILEPSLRSLILRYVYSLRSDQLMDLRILLLSDPVPTNLLVRTFNIEENNILDSVVLLKEQFEYWLRDQENNDPLVFHSNRLSLLDWYASVPPMQVFIVLTEWSQLRSFNNLSRVLSGLNVMSRSKRLRNISRGIEDQEAPRMKVILLGSSWFLSNEC